FLLAAAVPVFGAAVSSSPTTINFGSAPVNGSVSRTVTLTNTASDTAQISWAGVNGSQPAAFQVSGITAPLNLGAKKSITFTVKFAPKSSGSFSALLSVYSINAIRVEVPLSGSTGSNPPPSKTLSVSPSTLSFGNVTVNTTASKTVTLKADSASVKITAATT